MEVLTKILQQGTEFETLAETVLADRFERLVELVTMIGDKGELPIAMALASVVANPHMVLLVLLYSVSLYLSIKYVIPMIHVLETGTINRLNFSSAGFWYVCHAYPAPDSSIETLFYSKQESGVHVTEMMTYGPYWSTQSVDDNCLHFSVFSCCNLISN